MRDENTKGTWDEYDHFTPGTAVTHTMRHYPDNGPPFCKECSDAYQNWITWPCEAGNAANERKSNDG